MVAPVVLVGFVLWAAPVERWWQVPLLMLADWLV
jgi:hypothetical protein